LAGVQDWRAALRRIEAALGAARIPAKSEHLVARVKLVGSTPLAWRLRFDADRLAEEARAAGAAIGKTWIDKVEIACAEPGAAGASPSSDPVAELRALMEREVAQSKAFQDALREMAKELSGALPQELRTDLFGRDADEFSAILRDVASEGAEDVLAYLRAAERDHVS